MTQAPIHPLAQQALAAASAGHWEVAERLWRELLRQSPGDAQALHSLGIHAHRRGQSDEALAILQQAHRAAPRDPMILVSVALVLCERGDQDGEWQALELALAAQPAFLPALLAKAEHLERRASPPQAAIPWFRAALEAAGEEAVWPTPFRPRLQAARLKVSERGEAMRQYLEDRLAVTAAKLNPLEAARWREAGAIFSGRAKPYPSIPARLLVPRLPALPFFEASSFPWAAELRRRTSVIREEFEALRGGHAEGFQPYIAFGAGAPLKQWRELNHSARWSTCFLWRDGVPQLDAQRLCPETTAALGLVEMADIDGLCPNAMFSVLAPRTRIPPHHGETNARLVVHLPLIVPEGCRYRVGAEWREWEVGEALVFDDSIEHEARNDGDGSRAVLIFDVWNPLLSAAERDMVRQISAAARDFQAVP